MFKRIVLSNINSNLELLLTVRDMHSKRFRSEGFIDFLIVSFDILIHLEAIGHLPNLFGWFTKKSIVLV